MMIQFLIISIYFIYVSSITILNKSSTQRYSFIISNSKLRRSDMLNHANVLESSTCTTKFKEAIGSSLFQKLRQSKYYIDKSMFCKAFYDSSHETLLNTFPRRWCKSSNLDQLKSFYTIEVDENGNELKDQHKV